METQTNTKAGDITVVTSADLTGKEGRLVKLANSSGALVASLPAASTDVCTHIILRVNSATEAEVRPFSPEREHRVRLQGTCSPGDKLGLSDPTASSGANAGKLEVVTAGRVYAIAGETGADEQMLLVYRFNGSVGVVTDTTTNGACSGASDLAALKTETEAMGDTLRLLITKLAAAGVITTS